MWNVSQPYTQHILRPLRVLTPSPVKGANTSHLVTGQDESTYVKLPVQSLQQSGRNTAMTTSESGGLEHLYGHRSSPTLTQPRSAPSQGKARAPAPLCSQEVEESRPSPEVRPSRGLPQDHPQGGQGLGATAKQERRKADKEKGKGQKEVWKGNKKPPRGPEPPAPPVLNAALGPAASGTRETTTSWFLRNVQERVRKQLFGA